MPRCVVEQEDEELAAKPKTKGRKTTFQAETLLEYLPAGNVTEWCGKVLAGTGMSRTKFYDLKGELDAKSSYRKQVGTGTLVVSA